MQGGHFVGKQDAHGNLTILGPFRLLDLNGRRVEVTSKKGQALIAMLAVAGGGERTRSWLQDKLWGSRGQEQAQASLRVTLSALKTSFTKAGLTCLHSDHLRVWIDLAILRVDARDFSATDLDAGEFLEGLDIAGEESFEDWLRDERAKFFELLSRRRAIAQAQADQEAVPLDAITSAVTVPEPLIFKTLPALAILPFVNLSGNSTYDLLGEGLSEDLIDRLSRLKWLPIIARGSSFGFRGPDQSSKVIGEQLGARYLLDGRIRLDGDTPTIALSLTDCDSNRVIWSNKQDLKDHSPDFLQELLTGFALILGAKIDVQEQNRCLSIPQSDLDVRELIWRGRWHLNRFTMIDSQLAKEYFDEALKREPNSAEAIIQAANARLWDVWALRGDETEVRIVRRKAQKAIVADYDDARGHMIAGISESFLRQPIRAKALLQRAIDLNPSLFLAHGYLGSTLYLDGDPNAALVSLNFAVRLSPNDQHLFHVLGELAMCHFMLGDMEAAIIHADNSILRRPAYWYAHVIKIAALSKQGHHEQSQASLRELTQSDPQFQPTYIDWVPFCDRRWNLELQNCLNLLDARND
jgi:TolB-like protein/Flp pilus assembly protein TadD